MGTDIKIGDSAFLVNESRSRNVELSHDRFAHLWVTERTRELWKKMEQSVYPHDAIELGIRNRFFLERLQNAIDKEGISTFVNLGAGFTSYPFLIKGECHCIEVDLPHIIEFKKEQVIRWQEQGRVPMRPIEFIPCDLNSSFELENLKVKISKNSKPSFLLLEGLTYYLDPKSLQRIFSFALEIQGLGSFLTFDFWKPELVEHSVLNKFKKFLAEEIGYKPPQYNHFELPRLPGYELIEISDVVREEFKYNKQPVLSNETAILDSFAVLKRM